MGSAQGRDGLVWTHRRWVIQSSHQQKSEEESALATQRPRGERRLLGEILGPQSPTPISL